MLNSWTNWFRDRGSSWHPVNWLPGWRCRIPLNRMHLAVDVGVRPAVGKTRAVDRAPAGVVAVVDADAARHRIVDVKTTVMAVSVTVASAKVVSAVRDAVETAAAVRHQPNARRGLRPPLN